MYEKSSLLGKLYYVYEIIGIEAQNVHGFKFTITKCPDDFVGCGKIHGIFTMKSVANYFLKEFKTQDALK